MNQQTFPDQDMMTDVLSTQKFATDGYNNYANEASEPSVKNTMMTILDDEHLIQHQVYEEMAKRGWYQTDAAEQNKINTVKQKFAQDCKCCCN